MKAVIYSNIVKLGTGINMKVLIFEKFKFNLALLIIAISLNYGCSDGVGIGNLNLFSADDDVKLGAEIVTEMHKDQQNYPIYNNAEAKAYVQAIVNKIIQSPLVEYRDKFNYEVTLIDTETINAFALPGGYMHVYKGLLKYLDNEASLAAVLAHEVAHAERRHATKRLTKSYGVQLLLGLILGQNPSQLEEIAANLVTGLGFLYNSREDEYDSDEYSFKYLQSTEWYPGAGKYFFEKMAQDGDNGKLAELLSTHPSDQNRINEINAMIQKANLPAPGEHNLFAQRYLQFKQKLN